jgi:hypothetical protein
MSTEEQNLNAEKRATHEATSIRNWGILIASVYLITLIPIIGGAINRIRADVIFYALPVILIYWLIRYKLVNRISRTPRDLWLTIAILIGIIAVKAVLWLRQ